MQRIRKAFTVLIHDREYDVYDIEGKEHDSNDRKTYWVYYGDRLPENLIPSIDSDQWCPYNNWLERLSWEIKFKQGNTSKEKWGETRFSSYTVVEMWCNNKLIYSFSTWGGDKGMSYAMAKVQYLQTKICEHSFNFLNPDEEQGRKIWFYGLPATIQLSTYQKWEITIIPDYTTGLDKEAWWKEYKNRRTFMTKERDEDDEIDDDYESDYERDKRINWGDALSDQHIWWHRK